MTNGNEPVNFFEYEAATEYGDTQTAINIGFTKREVMAKDFMAALITYGWNNCDLENTAQYAILAADALITELNKTDNGK